MYVRNSYRLFDIQYDACIAQDPRASVMYASYSLVPRPTSARHSIAGTHTLRASCVVDYYMSFVSSLMTLNHV